MPQMEIKPHQSYGKYLILKSGHSRNGNYFIAKSKYWRLEAARLMVIPCYSITLCYFLLSNVGRNTSFMMAKASLVSCELYAPPVKAATISISGIIIMYCPPFPVAVLEIRVFPFTLKGKFNHLYNIAVVFFIDKKLDRKE